MPEQSYIPPIVATDIESTIDKERTDNGWVIEAEHEWQNMGGALDHARQLLDDDVALTYDDVRDFYAINDVCRVQYKYDYSEKDDDEIDGYLAVYTWGEHEYVSTVTGETKTTKRWTPFLEDDDGEVQEEFAVVDGLLADREIRVVMNDEKQYKTVWEPIDMVNGRAVTPLEFAHYHFYGGGEYLSEVEQVRQRLQQKYPSATPLRELLSLQSASEANAEVLAD